MCVRRFVVAWRGWFCARRSGAQDSHLLVITGVAGDEEHAKQFQKWATTLIDAAKTKDGVPDANITYLAEKPDVDAARIRGRSTSENVQKAVADLAAKAHPGDQVVIVLLIGHGSFDGSVAAFNLPGPDLTAADWASLLKKLSAQKVAFINTTSSSGAFLPAVAAPGRTVVTATKTGGERNETLFGEFFVEAFGDERGRRRPQRPRVGARGVQLREQQGREGVPAGRTAAHRARDARRRRRGEAGRRRSTSPRTRPTAA